MADRKGFGKSWPALTPRRFLQNSVSSIFFLTWQDQQGGQRVAGAGHSMVGDVAMYRQQHHKTCAGINKSGTRWSLMSFLAEDDEPARQCDHQPGSNSQLVGAAAAAPLSVAGTARLTKQAAPHDAACNAGCCAVLQAALLHVRPPGRATQRTHLAVVPVRVEQDHAVSQDVCSILFRKDVRRVLEVGLAKSVDDAVNLLGFSRELERLQERAQPHVK